MPLICANYPFDTLRQICIRRMKNEKLNAKDKKYKTDNIKYIVKHLVSQMYADMYHFNQNKVILYLNIYIAGHLNHGSIMHHD